ncbi:Cytochrome b-c1 complex subunit 2 [Yarrowia sp. B02]|nr:Cytochrome b-c1 complex subunit 2 [Yarrowia sp. B02]
MLSARSSMTRGVPRLALAARHFSTAEAAGVKVAAQDGQSPISDLSVVLRGGSRYASVPGVSHILEKFAFQNTVPKSALRFVRELELFGGKLYTHTTREHIVLRTQFLKQDLPYFVDAFANVLKETKFQQFELTERVVPVAQLDLIKREADAGFVALEAAHEVAFRTGLGNSVYAQGYSPVTLDDVKEFAKQVYAKQNVAVVGNNVVPEDLAKLVGSAFADLQEGSKVTQAQPTTLHGGEARVRASGGNAVTIALPIAEPKPVYHALASFIGGQAAMPWSVGASPLAQATAGTTTSAQASFHNYGDAGLFAITIKGASAAEITQVAHKAVQVLKDTGAEVTEEQAARAYAKSKFAAAEAFESPDSSADVIGMELLSGVARIAPENVAKFSPAELAEAAATLSAHPKPVVAAVGQVHALPFADELF